MADGQVESSEVTSEAVTQEPQEEIIHVGAKRRKSLKLRAILRIISKIQINLPQLIKIKLDQNKADQDKAKQEEAARQAAAAAAAAQEAARKTAEAEAQRKAQEQAAQQHSNRLNNKLKAVYGIQPLPKPRPMLAAAAQYGWTGDNWNALVWLWNRESGWRWNAENRSSGAYGIPQSLPGKQNGYIWRKLATTMQQFKLIGV